jgi:hypothetical protein
MTAVASSASIQNSEIAFSRGRLADWVARAVAILRNLGPYAAIELILPGGTLMALLLWLYRSHKKAEARVCTFRAQGRGKNEVTAKIA